jgi:hypothetical protein
MKTVIQLKRNTTSDTVLNADDQVLTAKSEYEFQIETNDVNKIARYVT